MSGLLIHGAGGHARWWRNGSRQWRASRVAFLTTAGLNACLPVLDWPVMGPLVLSCRQKLRLSVAVVAIGHAATRLHWIQQLQGAGYLPVLVHPTVGLAVFPARTSFCCLCSGCCAGSGTVDGCDSQYGLQSITTPNRSRRASCPGSRLAGE